MDLGDWRLGLRRRAFYALTSLQSRLGKHHWPRRAPLRKHEQLNLLIFQSVRVLEGWQSVKHSALRWLRCLTLGGASSPGVFPRRLRADRRGAALVLTGFCAVVALLNLPRRRWQTTWLKGDTYEVRRGNEKGDIFHLQPHTRMMAQCMETCICSLKMQT